MLGAIVGDLVGSRFEFNNHKSKDFDLFTEDCFVTDDSIMTLALGQAIMDAVEAGPQEGFDQDFHDRLAQLAVQHMQTIGRRYPACGYGVRFHRWIVSPDPKPYGSYGNGAAMRVSPAAYVAGSEEEARQIARTLTAITHNHKEGIKGAEATSLAIFMARKAASKEEIREALSRDYYDLDFRIDEIRPHYHFNESCQETVPQAIQCFLESTSFEDAIRTAISLGGDSDTLAAITGSIADAYYGVPDAIRLRALSYLDRDLRAIFDDWTAFLERRGLQA